MYRSLIPLAALALSLGLASVSEADVIAYWHFNDTPFTGNPSALTDPADVGSGTLTTQANSSGTNHELRTGTLENAQGVTPAGQAVAFRRGTRWNGGHWQVAFDATNLLDTKLTFAALTASNGVDTYQASYSTDGGSSFTNFGSTVGLTGSFATYTVDLGTLLAGEDDAVIRLTLSGASGSIGSTASRMDLDNVVVEGTLVPEPASLALLGLGGLCMLGGRRRRA